MAKTLQLGLPLVMPAQAQKHVTVNEALSLLDAAAQLRVLSSKLTAPPAATDGASFLVAAGSTGEWAGREDKIAVFSNGGWVFLSPKAGWRTWDEARRTSFFFDGTDWIADALVASASGAAIALKVLEFDHTIDIGIGNTTAVAIPSHAQVIGVTGRVLAAVTGTGLTGWRLGVPGASDRYGSGLGLGLNSYALGLTGMPLTYYVETPLTLDAEGGNFSGGLVRIAIHYVALLPPRST